MLNTTAANSDEKRASLMPKKPRIRRYISRVYAMAGRMLFPCSGRSASARLVNKCIYRHIHGTVERMGLIDLTKYIRTVLAIVRKS